MACLLVPFFPVKEHRNLYIPHWVAA